MYYYYYYYYYYYRDFGHQPVDSSFPS